MRVQHILLTIVAVIYGSDFVHGVSFGNPVNNKHNRVIHQEIKGIKNQLAKSDFVGIKGRLLYNAYLKKADSMLKMIEKTKTPISPEEANRMHNMLTEEMGRTIRTMAANAEQPQQDQQQVSPRAAAPLPQQPQQDLPQGVAPSPRQQRARQSAQQQGEQQAPNPLDQLLQDQLKGVKTIKDSFNNYRRNELVFNDDLTVDTEDPWSNYVVNSMADLKRIYGKLDEASQQIESDSKGKWDEAMEQTAALYKELVDYINESRASAIQASENVQEGFHAADMAQQARVPDQQASGSRRGTPQAAQQDDQEDQPDLASRSASPQVPVVQQQQQEDQDDEPALASRRASPQVPAAQPAAPQSQEVAADEEVEKALKRIKRNFDAKMGAIKQYQGSPSFKYNADCTVLDSSDEPTKTIIKNYRYLDEATLPRSQEIIADPKASQEQKERAKAFYDEAKEMVDFISAYERNQHKKCLEELKAAPRTSAAAPAPKAELSEDDQIIEAIKAILDDKSPVKNIDTRIADLEAANDQCKFLRSRQVSEDKVAPLEKIINDQLAKLYAQ